MFSIEKTAIYLLRRSKQMKTLPLQVACSKFCTESKEPSTVKEAPVKKEEPAPQAVPEENADNTTFKCKDYFEHNPMSFYDIEMEMEKYRQPQPKPVCQ
ncbi:hypothetical protein Ahia01_000782800 [Argonauta hians]